MSAGPKAQEQSVLRRCNLCAQKRNRAMSQSDSPPVCLHAAEIEIASRPVSRVLYGPRGFPRGRGGHSSGTSVAGCLGATHPDNWPGNRLAGCPATLSLFGLAPDGVYRAAAVAGARGGLLPHRFTLAAASRGGFFSVALSLRSGVCTPSRPDVIRHRVSMEPGLSSDAAFRRARQRPPGRLATSLMHADRARQGNWRPGGAQAAIRRNLGAFGCMVNRWLACER
jgi:hypothetical protein